MKRLILLIAAGLFSFTNVNGQILSAKQLDKAVKQYKKTVWEISLKGSWSNPYDQKQVTLDMEFTAPSGAKGVLPCFYVSGKSNEKSLWNARFAPLETGKYSVTFVLKQNGKEISRTKASTVNSKTSGAKGFLRPFNSWAFKYDNGDLFRGIGENIGWESRDEDDSKFFKDLHENKRFNYDYMVAKLAKNGGNFFRTWMIYWNLPVDWKQIQNNSRYTSTSSPYNESGMERMDKLVKLCDSLGVHMMLALESHVGFMGSGWETSSYNVKNGGYATTPQEFFESKQAREQYKNKLRLMVARYGYSPSIGVWEFFNEVDNAMYQGPEAQHIPHAAVTDWHNEMAAYLKDIDPYKHLVSTSISHRDIKGMNDIKSFDFNQKHIYCNTNGIPETINKYEADCNKPYVIGEFGYHWDWSINFNEVSKEFDGDFKKGLWLGLFSPTPILPMSWWWEFFENRGMMSYFVPVKQICNEMVASGNGNFEQVKIKVDGKDLVSYAVKCGEKIFVYINNSTNNTITGTVSSIDIADGKYKLELFNPENGSRNALPSVAVSNGKPSLQSFDFVSYANMIFIASKE